MWKRHPLPLPPVKGVRDWKNMTEGLEEYDKSVAKSAKGTLQYNLR